MVTNHCDGTAMFDIAGRLACELGGHKLRYGYMERAC
jgi:hypothetical protein